MGGLLSGTDYNWTHSALGLTNDLAAFTLVAVDVTQSPYSQQPYPPADDSDQAVCVVTGIAP